MGNIGFLKVRRGLKEHFNKMGYFEIGLYLRLLMDADYSTGTLYTSTNSLVLKGSTRQKIYRALQNLESKGYIRSFKKRGGHGEFGVILNRYQGEDGRFVNAFKSESCEELEWESDEVVMRSRRGDDEVVMRSSSQVEENKEDIVPKELRIKKEEERREESIGEPDMSLKNKITDRCRAILKIRLSPQDSRWPEVIGLGRQYQHHEIIDAFETWANTRKGDLVRYPLSEFLKFSDGYLDGTFSASEVDPEIELLSSKLYNYDKLAGTFSGKYLIALKNLAKKYTPDEIYSAYVEFLEPMDDFKKNSAVRDFCEGGAVTVIGGRKLRKEQDAEKEKLMQQITAEAQAEGARELAELQHRQKEEESLIEETL